MPLSYRFARKSWLEVLRSGRTGDKACHILRVCSDPARVERLLNRPLLSGAELGMRVTTTTWLAVIVLVETVLTLVWITTNEEATAGEFVSLLAALIVSPLGLWPFWLAAVPFGMAGGAVFSRSWVRGFLANSLKR